MSTALLPPADEMWAAFEARDADWDGLFFVAVRTTGIFCRPTCPARRPLRENVRFFARAIDAAGAGYRPCKRCEPLADPGATPGWMEDLLARVEAEPGRRWTDADLRALGLHPGRVRRWFRARHGTTFHAFARARRLGVALGSIRAGAPVTDAAFEHGFESLSGFHAAFRRVLGAAPRVAKDAPTVLVERLVTPLGPMVAGALSGAGGGLCLLEFVDRRMLERNLRALARRLGCRFLPGRDALLERLADDLAAYFEGAPARFELPLVLPGSEFQRAVWQHLRTIPRGTTASYAEVAAAVGRPSAVRAVARANGDNRVAIVVPCHRVIGKDGTLTGYGGGLWRKQRLLELEGARAAGGPDAQGRLPFAAEERAGASARGAQAQSSARRSTSSLKRSAQRR